MAHKKGQGSSRNGRDSNGQRRGTKRYGGEQVRAGFLSVCDVPTVVDLTGVADDDLGDRALEHLDPAADVHASADYRAHLVRVLTARVVAAARAGARVGP